MEGGEMKKLKFTTETALRVADEEAEAAKDDLDWSIYLVVNFVSSSHVAAIYEAKIGIRGGRVIGVINMNGKLHPSGLFFERERRPMIPRVACAALGSNLYLFGPEINGGVLKKGEKNGYLAIWPCGFNMETKETREFAVWKSPKSDPIVMTVNDKLYVLSNSATFVVEKISQPSFESFDPVTELWESLPHAPFHTRPFRDDLITGYAVLKYHILVTLLQCNTDEVEFFSYNLSSSNWKLAYTTKGIQECTFNGKAEVVDNAIFVYVGFAKLIAYPIIRELREEDSDGTDLDLSFASPLLLQGVDFKHPPEKWGGTTTEAIAKLGNRTLCLVQTGFNMTLSFQYACVTVVQIHNGLCIKTLSSSVCTLNTAGLSRVHISSCFVQPEAYARREHSGCTNEKHATRDNDALALGAKKEEGSMVSKLAEMEAYETGSY